MATFNSDYTPLQYNVAGNYKYRQTLLTKKQLQVQLSAGMRRRWVGPAPPDVFMAELMPISEEHFKEYEEKREEVRFRLLPPKGKRNASQQERRLYRAFAACIVRHDLSPNMPFFISADKKNKNTDCRPDAGLKNRILQKELHPVPATHPYATRSKAAAAANAPKEPRVLEPQPFNWNLDTLVVEFKGSSVNDPFYTEASIKKQMADTKRDYDVSFEKATSPARKVRGQLAMYAREIFNHQQRTHLFQLLITGRRARLIYFDHSGAIVSESIDYITNPGVLGEFFWRYNYMTDEARGIDTTTKKATDADEGLFTSAITELLANMDDPSRPERSLPGAEVTLDKDYPVYSMTVHEGVEHDVGEKSGDNAGDDAGPTTMELLVQRPIFDAVSPLGRGTRGYIAVAKTPDLNEAGLNDNEDKNPNKQTTSLFLKDTWRVDHALLKAESEVYRLLESYGVARIPRLICGGDVRDSSGKVQRTICAEWAQRVRKTFEVDFADFRAHLHHRLVQRLAYPIEAASRSEEMVKAFDNVLEVIDQAYTNIPSKVLHRDLSAGNVMLGDKEEDEVGLLGDWDHAIENEPKEGYDHQRYRTGTWPFISISLLNDPTKEHEILDDLESLFWTFLYSATHRFKHSGVLDMNIFNWWRDEYDKDGLPTGRILGGERKLAALPDIASGESILFDCQPLQTLIASLATSLYDYYHAINKVKIAGYALSNSPNNLIAKEEYQEACDTRDRLHTRLSKPAYWRARFQIALQSDASSWIDDVSDKPLHPPRTEDKQMQLQELRTRTSMQSGARPAKRPVVLPDAVDSDSEVEGEEAEVAEDSSCDEGDDSEAFDDDDLDKIFAPISQLHGGQESTKLGPSPPLSPSMAARSRIPRSTGSFPGHFEDDVLRRSASPTPSSKRTHEDSDVGARLPKRYRSAPGPEGMPPPVLPAVTRRAAGRAGRSRQPLSGEGSSSVVEPARVRYSLRSQSKSKGQDRVKKN